MIRNRKRETKAKAKDGENKAEADQLLLGEAKKQSPALKVGSRHPRRGPGLKACRRMIKPRAWGPGWEMVDIPRQVGCDAL